MLGSSVGFLPQENIHRTNLIGQPGVHHGGGEPGVAVAGRPTSSGYTQGADEKLLVYSGADLDILAEVLRAAEMAASRELPGLHDAGQVHLPDTHNSLN